MHIFISPTNSDLSSLGHTLSTMTDSLERVATGPAAAIGRGGRGRDGIEMKERKVVIYSSMIECSI